MENNPGLKTSMGDYFRVIIVCARWGCITIVMVTVLVITKPLICNIQAVSGNHANKGEKPL